MIIIRISVFVLFTLFSSQILSVHADEDRAALNAICQEREEKSVDEKEQQDRQDFEVNPNRLADNSLCDFLIENRLDAISDSFLVPSSPAFAILGVSPETVIRPTTPKALASSLINGLDPAGNLQTGFAIEFAPFLLSARSTTLLDYRGDPVNRIASRSLLSFAAVRGSSDDDQALRVAVGLRTTLLDRGDARASDVLDREARRIAVEVLDEAKASSLIERRASVISCQDSWEQALAVQDSRQTGDALDERTELAVLSAMRLQCLNHMNAGLDQMNALNTETTDGIVAASRRINGLVVPREETRISEQMSEELRAVYDNILEEIRKSSDKEKIRTAFATVYDKIQQDVEALRQKTVQTARTAWTSALDEFNRSEWNATNVTLGLAASFVSDAGDFGGLSDTGFAVYGTFAYGFDGAPGPRSNVLEERLHAIAHVRYQTNEFVAEPDEGIEPFFQDVLIVGGQLRVAANGLKSTSQGGPGLLLFAEFDYKLTDPDVLPSDGSFRYAGGVNFRIAKDVSLQISVGEESGSEFVADSTFVIGDLKYSF